MVMLKTWDDLNINNLPDYNKINFLNSSQYLNLNYYKSNLITF